MLRACRRVLKPGGRMAFYTLFVPLSLPEAVRREVARETFYTYSRSSPEQLLRSAGFISIEKQDVTAECLRVAKAWYAAWERRAERARATLGAKFDEQQAVRAKGVKRIEDGLMRRSLFVAERGGRA